MYDDRRRFRPADETLLLEERDADALEHDRVEDALAADLGLTLDELREALAVLAVLDLDEDEPEPEGAATAGWLH